MQGFRFSSMAGPFYILPGQDGWHATFGNNRLGTYQSAQHAADQLAGGSADAPALDVDTSTLEIPDEINEWEIVHC